MSRWAPAIDRFMAKVDTSSGECWIWTGATSDGYGDFYDGRRWQAHRWIYERYVAVIEDGMQLDHLCRIRACVRPSHLEPVSQAENIRRGAAVITHCPQGHPYSPENTYRAIRGDRQCRECMRQRNRSAARKTNPTRPNVARKEAS